MSKDIWFISDTHFSHEKTWKEFKRDDGTPLRPFTSTPEMDEALVTNWNSVVKPEDKVYHLGDVAMKDTGLKFLGACNGHKRLIRGNHDIFKMKMYEQYFEQIYGIRIMANIAFTHVPIHPDCINRRWLGNAHGHLHANFITKINQYKQEVIDTRYMNICVESTNYTPIHLEEIVKRFKELS